MTNTMWAFCQKGVTVNCYLVFSSHHGSEESMYPRYFIATHLLNAFDIKVSQKFISLIQMGFMVGR